jgi:RNA polymerase sigma-70 factor, ECF subfamily
VKSPVESSQQRWSVTNEAELLDFYDRSFTPAYRYAARLTRGDGPAAEDLVQDAFVRLVRALQTDDVDEIGVGWLITTIRRRFIDRLRSTEREDRRLLLVATEPSTTDVRPSTTQAVLEGLSDRERAALIFRYVDDLPVAEVARLLGSSVRATESLLQRAKRNAQGTGNAS